MLHPPSSSPPLLLLHLPDTPPPRAPTTLREPLPALMPSPHLLRLLRPPKMRQHRDCFRDGLEAQDVRWVEIRDEVRDEGEGESERVGVVLVLAFFIGGGAQDDDDDGDAVFSSSPAQNSTPIPVDMVRTNVGTLAVERIGTLWLELVRCGCVRRSCSRRSAVLWIASRRARVRVQGASWERRWAEGGEWGECVECGECVEWCGGAGGERVAAMIEEGRRRVVAVVVRRRWGGKSIQITSCSQYSPLQPPTNNAKRHPHALRPATSPAFQPRHYTSRPHHVVTLSPAPPYQLAPAQLFPSGIKNRDTVNGGEGLGSGGARGHGISGHARFGGYEVVMWTGMGLRRRRMGLARYSSKLSCLNPEPEPEPELKLEPEVKGTCTRYTKHFLHLPWPHTPHTVAAGAPVERQVWQAVNGRLISCIAFHVGGDDGGILCSCRVPNPGWYSWSRGGGSDSDSFQVLVQGRPGSSAAGWVFEALEYGDVLGVGFDPESAVTVVAEVGLGFQVTAAVSVSELVISEAGGIIFIFIFVIFVVVVELRRGRWSWADVFESSLSILLSLSLSLFPVSGSSNQIRL
ncbi:hypothetical protein EX30DRAFT_350816 [Ascodesmis nigricans]|uniref:Uncharacterized protein n=1 Tax=Ascodesmis nigricans TaxID=341454 RepID=A0A4S2MNR6_9PEZI|nr:hypothetical protein EX30DRAFT_350816 [Ascodesmis nigricans]